MENQTMLRGMANVSYYADDVKAARKWYTELFGIEPYFQKPDADNPAYIEYRIGDYKNEVGIIDKKYMSPHSSRESGGAILFWHVDDLNATVNKLISMGATVFEPIIPRGEGFITASLLDPFGNVLGVMHNPHYLEVLNS